MNFPFFEALNEEQATAYLDRYLALGCDSVARLTSVAADDGLVLDYTLSATVELFHWIVPQLEAVRRGPDPTVPEWIRSVPLYESGLFDFDQASTSLVVAWSYHLGETFVRLFGNRLHWAPGARDTAEANQPVVRGFVKDVEMSTLLVSENLFRRTLREAEPTDYVTPVVHKWRSMVS